MDVRDSRIKISAIQLPRKVIEKNRVPQIILLLRNLPPHRAVDLLFKKNIQPEQRYHPLTCRNGPFCCGLLRCSGAA